MKLLLVTHGFPPHATGGTETYTDELARSLAARGHEVHVWTALKDIARADLSLTVRRVGDVTVHELTQNLYYEDFARTFDHQAVERRFQELCERLRPDLVHVQHLLYLSLGLVDVAHALRVPVVFTLHDYWLECARLGQRVRGDGAVCHTIDAQTCATCLSSWKWAQNDVERRLGRFIAGVRGTTGVNLAPLAREAAARWARGQDARASERRARRTDDAAADLPGRERRSGTDRRVVARPDGNAAGRDEAREQGDDVRERGHVSLETVLERQRRVREELVPRVARFFSPSAFLRERFVDELRLDPKVIEHLPFGVDPRRFAPRERERSSDGRVRIAFIGALVPLKGAHLLLEAWGTLEPATRARASLTLFGPALHQPAYQRSLAARARELDVPLGGPLARDQVAVELARTDLLVMPSLWFENSPLILHEAKAMRTPLLVADLGGMAELVVQGEHGWHFRFADAGDLAQRLRAVIEGELSTSSLYQSAVVLPLFEEHVTTLEARYAAVVEERRG